MPVSISKIDELLKQKGYDPNTGQYMGSPNISTQSSNQSGFLGLPPAEQYAKELHNPENIKEMINAYVGAPGIKEVGRTAYGFAAPIIKKGIEKTNEFFHPEREAERFRSALGEGTSKENIEELGNRVRFAKQSALEESLIPKRQVYQEAGKKNIFNINPESLPEANIERFSGMMAPGEKFSAEQLNAVSKALQNYRKTGNTESFISKAEDILNLPELSEKFASKIEDILLMPTKRDSAYFSNPDVTEFYGKYGLRTLHDKFAKNPTLFNYDKLQSALKKEMRKLSSKGKNLDSVGEDKLTALKENVRRLDEDQQMFSNTLSEKLQNLEKEFRTKYAKGVAKYEEAPLSMRKLATGKHENVTPDQIENLFAYPMKEVKQILNDLGPSAGKNILYNALQRVPQGNAKKMAETLLDLKRTKSYDQFVTPEMEKWAHDLLKQIKYGENIKSALASLGGGLGGFALGGPLGGALGAAGAYGYKNKEMIRDFLRGKK